MISRDVIVGVAMSRDILWLDDVVVDTRLEEPPVHGAAVLHGHLLQVLPRHYLGNRQPGLPVRQWVFNIDWLIDW